MMSTILGGICYPFLLCPSVGMSYMEVPSPKVKLNYFYTWQKKCTAEHQVFLEDSSSSPSFLFTHPANTNRRARKEGGTGWNTGWSESSQWPLETNDGRKGSLFAPLLSSPTPLATAPLLLEDVALEAHFWGFPTLYLSFEFVTRNRLYPLSMSLKDIIGYLNYTPL